MRRWMLVTTNEREVILRLRERARKIERTRKRRRKGSNPPLAGMIYHPVMVTGWEKK